jgi:hypothetical protein
MFQISPITHNVYWRISYYFASAHVISRNTKQCIVNETESVGSKEETNHFETKFRLRIVHLNGKADVLIMVAY